MRTHARTKKHETAAFITNLPRGDHILNLGILKTSVC